MFYDSSELDKNFVGLETVKLELFAGGIGKEEEQQISEKIVDKDSNKVSCCFNVSERDVSNCTAPICIHILD